MLEESTDGHTHSLIQMHVRLPYTIERAHLSPKGLEGCDTGELMAALEVTNRPR